MNTFIKAVAVSAFAFAFLAGTAGATNLDGSFDALFDGYQEVTGEPRENVEATFRVEIDSGEVLHAIGIVKSDGTGETCHDIRNYEGEQDKNISVDIELPATTGDFDLDEVNLYVADSMQEANALRGDVACAGTPHTSDSFFDVLHVVPSSSNGTGSSEPDEITSLWDRINALTSLIQSLTQTVTDFVSNPEPPAPSGPACPPSYMGFNRVEVQSWLMLNGYAGPFNSVGIFTPSQLTSPSIIWGPVSQGAYSQALDACHN